MKISHKKAASSQRPAPASSPNASNLFKEALAFHQAGQLPQAQALYVRLASLDPAHFEAAYHLGLIAINQGNMAQAQRYFSKASAINPRSDAAHCNLGFALSALDRHPEAVASYQQALVLNPTLVAAHYCLANSQYALKQYAACLSSYQKASSLRPEHVDTYLQWGNACMALKLYADACTHYAHVIRLQPGYAEAYVNQGDALQKLGQTEDALASYSQALALNPYLPEAYLALGLLQTKLKQHPQALESLEAAKACKPGYADAYANQGIVLNELTRYPEAIACYEKAIQLSPSHFNAHYNLGIALSQGHRFQAALQSYNEAIRLKPDFANAYMNRGLVLMALGEYLPALESYNRALILAPDFAKAYSNRGNLQSFLKQAQAAIASYDQALAAQPDIELVWGMRLHTKMKMADWQDHHSELAGLINLIERNALAGPPLAILSLSSQAALQRQAVENYMLDKHPANTVLGPLGARPPGDKIRLGYFSMDFWDHPVSALTVGLFEAHDRSRFEIIAFSFSAPKQDSMRQRLEAAFDQFIDVYDLPAADIAALARSLHIDIGIDLAGLTGDARTNIFACSAAPVQVNYLGYPGTLGAPYFDYIVADAHLIPEASQAHYAEKIAYLPSYQPNDRQRAEPTATPSRASVGLPAQGFVYCCFNNSYKINPSTFDRWVRILLQVPGSVLWLYEENTSASANLRLEAQQRGLDPQRLLFAQRTPQLSDHLARYQAADLFLDTSPYNAHTTASDALWAGLPLLTCPGESFASRVASSVLHAIGLPELIAASTEAYEALAIAQATQPGQLQHLKQKLAANRLTTPLFDTARYTRHLEDAYTQMHTRHLGGLVPEHLTVMDAP